MISFLRRQMNFFLTKKQIVAGLLLLTGSGLFAQPFTEQTGIVLPEVYRGTLTWGDYDMDGDLDIFMTGAPDESKISGTTGTIHSTAHRFSISGRIITAHWHWEIMIMMDTSICLLAGTTNGAPSGGVSKVFHNKGNNAFVEQAGISLPGITYGSVAWIDYDKDGDLDILLSGASPSDKISEDLSQ